MIDNYSILNPLNVEVTSCDSSTIVSLQSEKMSQDPDTPAPPASKDSANQSAALSNLSDSHTGDPSVSSNSTADTAKLGAALSGLSVGDKAADGKQSEGDAKKAEAPKKVKVNAEDVNFLVEQLEVSKTVATGMLKGAEGSREKAVESFVVPKGLQAVA